MGEKQCEYTGSIYTVFTLYVPAWYVSRQVLPYTGRLAK